MKHARNTLKFIIMAGMALLLLLGAAAVPVAAEEPTVIVSHYIVTPSVLVPDGYGTIQVTLTNTAGTAVLRESSGISAAGSCWTGPTPSWPSTSGWGK